MRKVIGDSIFTIRSGEQRPNRFLNRVSASEHQLPESWFRDAIFACPDLVVDPCRKGGRLLEGEAWLPWAREFSIGDAGRIDVLLISSRGRIGIVETKLSYNPGGRREVVAQTLEYALALQEQLLEDLPEIPDSDHAPSREDLEDGIAAGDFLLVIAGDETEPRAIRLASKLIGGHLTSGWDLVMIDLNLYRSGSDDTFYVVPEMRGELVSEIRQVVKVEIKGEQSSAKVSVSHFTTPSDAVRNAVLASDGQLLDQIGAAAPESRRPAEDLLQKMRDVCAQDPDNFNCKLGLNAMNFYWAVDGHPRRVFSVDNKGRFRVWLAYVRDGPERPDAADRIREIAASVIPREPIGNQTIASEKSENVVLSLRNVDAIKKVISDVVISLKKGN